MKNIFQVKNIIGAYLIFYFILWLFERLTPNSGKIYVISLAVMTLLFAWMACFQALPGWRWGCAAIVRVPLATIVSVVATYVIFVATLFDPLGIRPSPIPLSDKYLFALSCLSRVMIGIGGVYLLVQSKRS